MKLRSFKELNNILPIISHTVSKNENIIVVSKTNLLPTLTFLKNHISSQYKVLTCISGVDFLKTTYRFGVVYDLLSITFASRLRVKIFVNETTSVSSVVSIYQNANWWEREVWDFYGIYFNSHPDLRRILTDYGFEGYPMRKDFPLSGFFEMKFDSVKNTVGPQPIQLAQEYRVFNS